MDLTKKLDEIQTKIDALEVPNLDPLLDIIIKISFDQGVLHGELKQIEQQIKENNGKGQ